MNEWGTRTLAIVDQENYLDRLLSIYPNDDLEREVDEQAIQDIQDAFEAGDNHTLLERLLDLEKFPYKDSYVGFLRSERSAIARNPETVERICTVLYGMGLERVIAGVRAPKEANTRRGPQFRNWMRERFRWLPIDEFRASTAGIVMLEASELAARNFCNVEMGVGIAKRPDVVAKVGRNYVVGEAKFLSSTGGNQGRGFDDGIGLASNNSGTAFKIFVLDGILWIERGSDQFRRIEFGNSAVFSALLLEEYLQSIA
jgi:hypothetical protein